MFWVVWGCLLGVCWVLFLYCVFGVVLGCWGDMFVVVLQMLLGGCQAFEFLGWFVMVCAWWCLEVVVGSVVWV